MENKTSSSKDHLPAGRTHLPNDEMAPPVPSRRVTRKKTHDHDASGTSPAQPPSRKMTTAPASFAQEFPANSTTPTAGAGMPEKAKEDEKENIEMFMGVGATREEAIRALNASGGNLERAMSQFFQSGGSNSFKKSNGAAAAAAATVPELIPDSTAAAGAPQGNPNDWMAEKIKSNRTNAVAKAVKPGAYSFDPDDEKEGPAKNKAKGNSSKWDLEKGTQDYDTSSQKEPRSEDDAVEQDEKVFPGAVRMAGPDSHRRNDAVTVVSEDELQSKPPSPQAVRRVVVENPSNDAELLADAVLVDREEEERQIRNQVHSELKQNAPIADVVKERPWYKRRWFFALALLILIVAGAVAGAIVGTRSDDKVVVESTSPTSSPAPTALALITIVLQLDAKKEETGWSLVCDGVTIQDVPPGSYAFIGSPHFRVEYFATVTQGDECELTILDTGNDGIENGFFGVYYGQDYESQANRITGGFINPAETKTTFTVDLPNNSPPSSTMEPTPSPPIGITPICTICPDGSAVNEFAQATNWDNMNCVDLESSASNFNATECKKVQDSAARDCGCSSFCTTICPDLSDPPAASADNLVLVRNNQEVTCGDFQREIASSGSNDFEKCLFANLVGEDVCGCEPTDRFCRLCQGDAIPPAGAAEKEIIPGLTCRDISGLAYTLRAADPSGVFFLVCPACLAIGAYCGCSQPPPDQGGLEFCRLCGDNEDLLPEPARLVNSTTLEQTTTCFHVEFNANFNATDQPDCQAFRDDAASTCCS